MRITQEDVLRAVQELGPVVANKIKQRLGESDSMLIQVYLSELQKEKKVRMTHLQLGSSSFAYTPQQVPQLENLAKHLNEKDRRAAQKLKQASILRANTQDPLTRVSLQTIKDFAKPLQVKTAQGEETFYRWYTVSSEQAQEKIKEILGVTKKAPESQEETTQTPPTEKETQESVKKQEAQKPSKETQQPLTHIDANSEFAEEILAYIREKNVVVHQFEEVRKGSEIDAIIELPTAVGNIKYYCKAKSKKNSNDGDLAAAILTAKSKMLPALYITTGTVTNKAKENKELQEITVVELGN